MAVLIWAIRKIAHMIKTFKYSTVIYIDHGANLVIATETKFSTTNIDKLNLKLIRASIYFFQFRFEFRHRFDKFNIVFDVLSRLPNVKSKNENNLNINAKNPETDHVYAYAISFMKMSTDFKNELKNDYEKNPSWKKIKSILKKFKKKVFFLKKKRRFFTNKNWLCHEKRSHISFKKG